MGKKIMFVAGGTGGHIFPGIAVAQYLQKQGWEVLWLGTSDRMEAEVVPKHGFGIKFIKVKGIRGNGLKRLFQAPIMVLKAILQARKIMQQTKPDIVLGMGGYVTGPAGIAAKTLRIPLVIHEQNAVAGMTNRLLAKFADQVLVAFPNAFGEGTQMVVGNPVRDSVSSITHEKNTHHCHILVVGGSLGAKVLNDNIPMVAPLLHELKQVDIWHQTGKGWQDEVTRAYKEFNINAKVEQFIDDIDLAYSWADIVICRAGALTVSEIAAAGKMAVFVPFPHAVDDHQTANAQYLVDKQAALMIAQSEMTKSSLFNLLKPYIEQPDLIDDMAKKAKSMAVFDSDQQVAEYIENMVKER